MDFVDIRLSEMHLFRDISPSLTLDVPSSENCPPDSIFFLAYELLTLCSQLNKRQISLVYLLIIDFQSLHGFSEIGAMTVLHLFAQLDALEVMGLKLQPSEFFL